MFDVIDTTALTLTAATAALIVTLTVHAADSRRDPHRYDASRCPTKTKTKTKEKK